MLIMNENNIPLDEAKRIAYAYFSKYEEELNPRSADNMDFIVEADNLRGTPSNPGLHAALMEHRAKSIQGFSKIILGLEKALLNFCHAEYDSYMFVHKDKLIENSERVASEAVEKAREHRAAMNQIMDAIKAEYPAAQGSRGSM
ncbi:uncharacterized protein CTRU02_208524 [Colletotrichum truncatum]|uniref:Uncharacterized protein n=1 Tax=Colletotrichum truncatum TaxID=5467 RepID=A0ACC3YWQ4_COLTU|nr:uncharacterized protein CTRU02_10280 [Colletotrichum truncatum]KAF6787484.1 hypothetical protein CTRU02_10280 [Colletotrichum truncatum]